MPIRRSVQAYRAATPIEQAACVLAAILTAVAVPALLRWVIGGIADAGRGQGGYPAAATRMAVDATSAVVQWVGIGVLAALAVGCAVMTATYLRDARARSVESHPRTVAQVYALGTVVAVAGVLWLV